MSTVPLRLPGRNNQSAMLLSIQFPFADFREFVESPKKLPLPAWPLPTPDHEFVRGIGPIRIRRRGGVGGWIGEDTTCVADRALVFNNSLNFRDSKSELQLELRCAFKRLYFDGCVVGKFEIGIATKASVNTRIQSWQFRELIQHVLKYQVLVGSNNESRTVCSLIGAGKHLADQFYTASTPHEAESRATRGFVEPGLPLLFIEADSNEAFKVPFWSRPTMAAGKAFDLSHCLVPHAGLNIRMWILRQLKRTSSNNISGHNSLRQTRILRVALHRLHAEHEALRLVLRSIMSGAISVSPRSPESDRLQFYVNNAIARIGSVESDSYKLIEPKIVDLAREALDEIVPGQRDALLSTLERFGMRRNVYCKLVRYIDECGSRPGAEARNQGVTYHLTNSTNAKIMASGSQSFEDTLRLVSSPGSAAYEACVSGISVAGFLDCPSPKWDAGGVYRLATESGILVIQKLVSGSWIKANTDVSIEAVKTSSNAADDSFSSKTRSILYMDVSGWSKLAANDIHAYASKGLKALSHRLEGYDFINTWGDSIVATFESVKTAAEMALRIQEFFANSYPDNGVSSGLTCRVSLHLGEIICCRNALRNELDVFGEAVHVAARLEPVTAPGAIFCTQAFADRLREVQGSAPKAWPLGQLELAKGFGRVEVFAVTGPNAQDPRSLYGHPSSESSQASVINDVPLPDESARTRLKGWLNKLPLRRSGEAIALNEIEANCGLQAGQAFRVISEVVPGGEGAWNLEDLTEHDVILKYVRPKGPSRQFWITRY